MMYISICGNIASGKTTFLNDFRSYGISAVHENFLKNPFLDSFYVDTSACAFETELVFLLLHYNSLKCAMDDAVKCIVCDYSIVQDRAYADVTLSDSRLRLFMEVADSLEQELGDARLLVYLECAEGILLQRIQKRARVPEQGITEAYLKSVADALELRVEEASKTIPVLRIDSHAHDFRNGLDGHDFLPTLLEYLK